VGGAVVGLTALLWGIARHDARGKRITRKVWSESARQLGIRQIQPPGGGHALAGTIDGFEVEVRTDQNPELIRARLKGGGRIPEAISVEAARFWSSARSGAFLEVGDEEFDGQVRVAGPEDAVLAALGSEGRAAVRAFVQEGGKAGGGELEVPCELHEDPEIVERVVRRMLACARALSVTPVAQALLENVTEDPCSRVRRKSLTALVGSRPGSKEAIWALQAGLRDLDAEVRLFAAERSAGDPEARRALAELVDNAEVAEAVRAKALALLAAYPYAEISEVVSRALAAQAVEVRRAAVSAVGLARDAGQLETLLAMAEAPRGAGVGVGEALAEALGRLGGPRAEDGLLSLLSHEAREVQEAAAKALGECGTIRVVEPLLQSARAGAVGSAARDAVRRIQARLGDAGAGRLSVVEAAGAEGAVSLENPVPDGPEKADG